MNVPVPGGEVVFDIEAIARRVVEKGVYARFSQREQLAVCQWVLLEIEALRTANDATFASDSQSDFDKEYADGKDQD